jgi:hypothetical protein
MRSSFSGLSIKTKVFKSQLKKSFRTMMPIGGSNPSYEKTALSARTAIVNEKVRIFPGSLRLSGSVTPAPSRGRG